MNLFQKKTILLCIYNWQISNYILNKRLYYVVQYNMLNNNIRISLSFIYQNRNIIFQFLLEFDYYKNN